MTYASAFALWTIMTAIMMVPVVAPWLRAVHGIESGFDDRQGGRPSPNARRLPVTAGFTAGYAAAWLAFSAAAAALQWGLSGLGLTFPLLSRGGAAAGLPLMLVGAYQFTEIKNRCLSKCRSPMGYFMAHWRPGGLGGLSMGVGRGLHCLGCCWALMLLALVVGHMHPVWMVVLMGVMVFETVLPGGQRMVRPLGAGLLIAGLAVLFV